MKRQDLSWVEDNSFSVFADNLPKDVTIEWLWKVFSSTGRVIDVYLSRKVRPRNPLKFAFIRYAYREEVQRTIEQLDGWLVWGCRIRLTESRYKRGEKRERVAGNGTMQGVMQQSNPIQNDRRGADRTNNGGLTYKETLVKPKNVGPYQDGEGDDRIQTLGDSKIYLNEDCEVKEMLNRCLVGETLEPYDLQNLEAAIMDDWSNLKGVKMIGPMKVLLIFDTPQEAEKALDSEKLKRHFLELRWATIGEANWNRKYWIMVTGLPMHGWTKDNMEKIGRVWGRVIQIEEEICGHYNFFRVQIVANIGPSICALAAVVIGEETFNIFIKEDGERACVGYVRRIIEPNVRDHAMGSKDLGSGDTHIRDEQVNTNAVENIPAVVETQNAVAMAVEGEESMVGEAQSILKNVEDDPCRADGQTSPNVDLNDNSIGPSPTRTKFLQDDKRTEDVIQEWGEVLYQKA
ncbi:hypothetical protein PIB30_042624 [Stylosanthes scabra]|uniref:RRM domain-containing protein n=1 Tax=Stylosanthes scabra TaxID=79078 RepID=A0ABU6YE36_9FABA|nr:hypothetical protein [Stylosanthes scabra]